MSTIPEIVKDIPHLLELIRAGRHSYFIALAGGMIRSSKEIREAENGGFDVVNEIDGTAEILSEVELYTHSTIGEAIDKKCLIAD